MQKRSQLIQNKFILCGSVVKSLERTFILKKVDEN